MKRLSFITQFKIQFLLLFTSCRKVLGKLPNLKVRNIFMEKLQMHENIYMLISLHNYQQLKCVLAKLVMPDVHIQSQKCHILIS